MVEDKYIERFVGAFDRISMVFASMESFAGDISLSKPEILAMESVFKQEALIMSRLANNLNIAFSTATKIIDRLMEKKLVIRKRNDDDRRVVKVVLTKKGKEIVLVYQQQKKEMFKRMLDTLAVDEQEYLISIFDKIGDTLGER